AALSAAVVSCAGGAARRGPSPAGVAPPAASQPNEGDVASFASGGLRLRVEALRADLVHFEIARAGAETRSPIPVSPMVHRAAAPIAWKVREGNVLATEELRVEVDPASLCVRVADVVRGFVLHRACPRGAARLSISRERTENVYGLGEQLVDPGHTDADWLGRERTPGSEHGNAMVPFDGTA